MTTQNWCAIIAMFAVVITLYAIRDSHTLYLADFFGLALALIAPRPGYAIGAVAILALIRHSGLANGLAVGVPGWLLPVLLPGAAHMSISDGESSAAEDAYKERISEPETNLEYVEIPQPVAENSPESITLGETRALARLVAQERIGLTEAVKIGAGAKSGAKYQKRSKEIKAEVERLRNHFPPNSTHKRYD